MCLSQIFHFDLYPHTVCHLQEEAGEQEGSSSDSVQRTGHLPAGERSVQTDGQPASRAAPGTQEEVQGTDCKTSMC